MADGKVMQKYYPPDFDPEALKRNKDVVRAVQRARQGKRGRGQRMMEMRMMFPFTLFCENCKDFVYVGTKFNSKVERARGEDYLGIPIWRFYGRCPHCRHPIVFRTDPKNTDYILESGGTRTYDSNRDVNLAEAALRKAQEQEVEGDAVKALEVKSYSTAEELKTIEALDELRRINRRLMSRPDQISDYTLQKLNELHQKEEDLLDQDEITWAKELFANKEFGDDDNSSGDDDNSSGDDDGAKSADEEPGGSVYESADGGSVNASKAGATLFQPSTCDLQVDGSRRQPPKCNVSQIDKDLDSLLDQLSEEEDRCSSVKRNRT